LIADLLCDITNSLLAGIATGYGLDDVGFGLKNFHFSILSKQALGPIQQNPMGTEVTLPSCKVAEV
jgi:hypothetical protein